MSSSSSSRLPAGSAARAVRRGAIPAFVLALGVGAAACSSSTGSTSKTSGTNTSATQLESQYEQVIQHVLPSVVQISTSNSTGSGVVYDTTGDIVTNAHVIGSATTVTVREPVGTKQLNATVIGTFRPTTSR